jgi:hypothetical protein
MAGSKIVSGMPKNSVPPQSRSNFMSRWMSRAPYAIVAILLHLLIFVLFATYVIFKAPAEPRDASTFGQIKIAIPPPAPPTPPAPSGGEARTALEPTLTVIPTPAVQTAITSSAPTAFTVDASKMPMPNLPSISPPQGTGMADAGASGNGLGIGSVFGSTSNTGGNGFAGYFYDLKQTPDHTPTGMNADREQALLKQFFKEGWNEDDWPKRFLKSTTQLFANELMVPLRFSSDGPKAYGLDGVCKPGYWCALYHLTLNATQSGDFRVAGYGDDFLVVRVNSSVVLDSGWYPPVTGFKRQTIYPSTWLKHPSPGHPDYCQTVVGTPFHLDMGDSVTIDVLIGDADPAGGMGRCGYFLFLLKSGQEYGKDAEGNPLLPVLQVQPNPNLDRPGDHPPFTSEPEDSLLGTH